MKIQISVEVDGKDAQFFDDLVNGNYSWATSAKLSFTGIGDPPAPVDATWILRAGVAIDR